MPCEQIFLPHAPRPEDASLMRRYAIEKADWVWHPALGEREPAFLRFTLDFQSDGSPVTFHLSADQWFELTIDDDLVLSGPPAGDPKHWEFLSARWHPSTGTHRLVAKVWWLAQPLAPEPRMTLQGGFLFHAEGAHDEQLSTGKAPWTVERCTGWEALPGLQNWGHSIGCGVHRDLRVAAEAPVPVKRLPQWWDNIYGIVTSPRKLAPTGIPAPRRTPVHAGRWVARVPGWLQPADRFAPQHLIAPTDPATRLPQPEAPLVIPPHTTQSLLLDLGDYQCGFPRLTVSGGRDSVLELHWAESLATNADQPKAPRLLKGHRDELAGKGFLGFGDRWTLDGQTHGLSTHWWRAGRYVLVRVKSEAQALEIKSLDIAVTGYPWPVEKPPVEVSDGALAGVLDLAWAGFRACTHDTFIDCPYYEQLQYVADTRLMMLVSYVCTGDDRLARRAIELFDLSRRHHGLPAMRYPSGCEMVSPTFALWWVGMVHDFARWRADKDFVRARLPGIRATLEALAAYSNADGLLEYVPGWPFVDWGTPWDDSAHPEAFNGVPAGARGGVSAIVNLHYLLALQQAAELEAYVGIPEYAAFANRQAQRLRTACRRFIADNGLVRDSLGAEPMSEHAQVFGLLANLFEPGEIAAPLDALAKRTLPARASAYFLHHLFDACSQHDRADLIPPRLDLWHRMRELGLRTPLEEPEPSRSDCHGWGSHPLYHTITGLLGLRPTGWEGRTFSLNPATVSLGNLSATIPLPQGSLTIKIETTDRRRLTLDVPSAVTVVVHGAGTGQIVPPGRSVLDLGETVPPASR